MITVRVFRDGVADEGTIEPSQIAECLAKVPTDPLAARYRMLAEQLEQFGVPDGWDNIEQM